MKAIQIKVEPFQFLSIQKLFVHRKSDCHSKLFIQGLIQADSEMDYYNYCIRAKHPELKMIAVDEQTDKDFFCGIIIDFSMKKEGKVCSLSLEVSSGSYLMDLKEHQRFYQREDQPVSEIFEEICNAYPSCNYLFSPGQKFQLNQFTIQYRETDWDFLKRLASRNHLPLIPADYIPGIYFYVGINTRNSNEISEDTYTILNDVRDYYKKSSQMDYHSTGSISYGFSSREIYHIGDEIIFNRIKMYIYEIESELNHGELVHHYKIKAEHGFQTVYKPNSAVIGASFDAEVAEVEKDKVMVSLLKGENSEQSPAKLFPFSTVYSSQDGTGWYCMPEPGDTVRLYIPSEQEADGYVISAVHQKSADSNARVHSAVKSLKTRYGKEVYFTPDSIVMTNHKGNTIILHDENGILIESDKDIVMRAEGDISLTSMEQTLLLNAADKIDICQGGTQLTVDDDIAFKGGKLRME